MLRMNRMRSLALTLALAAPAALIGSPDSHAQGYDPGVPFAGTSQPGSWTGWYIGGQLGGGVGNNNGFIGGGTLGYNLQSQQLVWGIETDFSGASLDGTRTDLDWLWTLRGRLGVPLSGNILPYVTAGLAVGDVDATVAGFSVAETNAGWTVGGGLEIELSRNWTIKGEYLYVDLGDVDTRLPIPASVEVDDFHILRAGINFKF